MKEGKRGWIRRHRGVARAASERVKLYTRIHGQADRPGMLRRTYYGARQYLNTLDGKVVHEGEIGTPLCSGVRRVRARGWTERP